MSYSRRSSRYSSTTESSSSRADAYSDIFEEGRRVLAESRQKTIDWDEKMQDYATQRRLRTRRLMRKNTEYVDKKNRLNADDELESFRKEKAKRRASVKKNDVEEEPAEEIIKRDRSKVHSFINECKELLNRQSTSSYESSINPETNPTSTTSDSPEIVIEEDILDFEIRERKDRLELLSGELEKDNLDGDIANIRLRERLADKRARVQQIVKEAAALDNIVQSDTQSKLNLLEMAKRREEIEAEIEKQKIQQEMKEKKRKAFLKKQNKIYCKIVWKELAEKNSQK